MIKILYVEDNEDNVYMLSERLRRKGFEVVVARNGAQGIAMAETERPAVILMDLDLPVINGWEATQRLKTSPATRHIPIVALSAHAMSTDKDRALAAGCDEFETTPVNLERLLEKIASLVR
jgi:CheY-like chemotaxis protein